MKANILIIDDDESMREGCRQTLEEDGFRVRMAENGARGLELTARESFDIILLDLKMPGLSGMEVLGRLKESNVNSCVIVITGFATVDAAVEAMKLGACDFITKPFGPETLTAVVERVMDSRIHDMEEAIIPDALRDEMIHETIVGNSECMKKLAFLIRKVAPTDSTVLVTGETGVGKELVARTIHRLSSRSEQSFVTVDCGVLVESLFESEMFGHVKGAFTGATDSTSGKFELADGGTISSTRSRTSASPCRHASCG